MGGNIFSSNPLLYFTISRMNSQLKIMNIYEAQFHMFALSATGEQEWMQQSGRMKVISF